MNKLYRFLILLVFFGLWISCASAANVVSLNNQAVEMNTVSSQDIETTNPVNWAFSPLEPVCGDTLYINGSASPEEKVNVSVTFNKTVPVSKDGRFEYTLENVTVPEGLGNLYTVEASGAKNLNVKVKKIIWLTKSSKASGNTATVSQSNVPPGTYNVKIDGDAKKGVTGVNLKIIASQIIQTDSNGNFSYSYNTTAVPPGNFEVKVGDITKEITLRPNKESTNPINWVFFPPEPVCGDTLYIIGSASPEEKVNASVAFNKTVSVSEDGRFEYTLENVTVPEGLGNLYTVEANGAKNLNVRVKMAVWVTKSSNASGDTATVSQSNVPAGTYNIKIDGDAGEGVSEVNLRITAFEKIKADSNGIFSYSYNTTAVPPGNFKVKVGDITKEITLRPNREPTIPINWIFFPLKPVCGDTLYIIGSVSPEDKVNVSVAFNKTVSVSEDGRFEYTLENVTVPEGLGNLYTVEANGAKNLNVRVKMAVWVTKSSNALGDTATVSQSNVPAGTYNIKIDGDAGEGVSEVNLRITAFEKIKADSNGIFSYSYNTTAVPPGKFEVKVGDITKEITLTPLVLPVANFSSDISAGYTPLTVQFTDLSENATFVNWDFENDGVSDSTERNPIHKFTTAGTYTVNLTAINENGINSTLGIIEVTKKPIPGHTKLPTDPNNDGRYEDVNGNGGLDFDDVVVLYGNMDWIKENVPVTLFDYNNNGRIDFNDIVKLYKKV